MYQLHAAKRSDQGRRPNNEDFVDLFEPDDLDELKASGCLYLVADGVGRASQGERASQYAVLKVLYQYYRYPELDPGERLSQALRQANRDIYQYAEQSDRYMRMATTMVAAVIWNDILTVANVGDSRAYLIRNGQARKLTDDHTVPGEMVRNKVLTEEEAQRAKGKNRLTRSLGGESDVRVDIFSAIQLQPGDRVLLCTDGFWGSVTRRDIEALTQEGSAEEVVDRLVGFAERCGSNDNISAIVIDVGQPVDEAAFAQLVSHASELLPVDWETLVSVVPVAASPWEARTQLLRRYMPFILLAVVFIFGMGVIGTGAYLVTRGLSSGGHGGETATATVSNTLSFPAQIVPQPHGDFNLTPTQTITPENTASLSPSPTVTVVVSLSVSIIPQQQNLTCRYTIQLNEALESIYKKLGKTGLDYSKAMCAPLTENGNCKYDPNSPNYLQQGWVLDIENVDTAKCKLWEGIPLK